MNMLTGGFVMCLLGLVACNVEHYEDCGSDAFDTGPTDEVGGREGRGGSYSGGSSASSGGTAGVTTAGTPSGGGRASEAGSADGGAGGADAAPPPTALPCDEERDCPAGFNCNFDSRQCQPAAEETCGELTTELACTHRSDCTPIYAGTHCSCGQDCACHGGEPGCVCETFEFFGCQSAE